MRRIIFVVIQVFCFTAGFAQNPPWKANGEAISPRPDLDVRWEGSRNFSRKVWVYDLLPNKFSPAVISNVMALCSFTEKDKIENDTNGIAFQNADRSRTLSISFSSGEIEYETREIRYSPTNLAVGVPQISQLPPMATNLLHELHINFSDITGYFGTNKIEYLEPALTMFYVGETTITNIPYRTILFKRAVDGMPMAHHNNRFDIGEHGRILTISITWPNLKRVQSYRTVSSKDAMNFIRASNAIRGPAPTSIGDIDWANIKSVTIVKAVPTYQLGNNQLYPFLRLDALVDTGNETVKIGMDCPIIDETKIK